MRGSKGQAHSSPSKEGTQLSNGGHRSQGGNPFVPLEKTEKWSDGFQGKKAFMLDSVTNVSPEDVHKAQLRVVSTARALGYSNGESKDLLEHLGIAEKVEKGEGQGNKQG